MAMRSLLFAPVRLVAEAAKPCHCRFMIYLFNIMQPETIGNYSAKFGWLQACIAISRTVIGGILGVLKCSFSTGRQHAYGNCL